jgi:gliding motility-associated-like protein
MSLLTKVIIGASISVAVITTAVILIPTNSDSQKTAEIPSVESDKIDEVERNIPTDNSKTIVTNQELQTVDLVEASGEGTNEGIIDDRSEDEFEMPITVFEEGIIEEDCINCDLTERNDDVKTTDLATSEEENDTVAEDDKTTHDKVDKEEAKGTDVTYFPTAKPVYYIEQYTNVFSPNGDGINDNFALKIDRLDNFQIIILDFTTQKEVFQARDIDFTWDGTDKFGNPVKEGDYLYMINALDFDGNPIREIKSLKIAR